LMSSARDAAPAGCETIRTAAQMRSAIQRARADHGGVGYRHEEAPPIRAEGFRMELISHGTMPISHALGKVLRSGAGPK
jgi:hypothetical protein